MHRKHHGSFVGPRVDRTHWLTSVTWPTIWKLLGPHFNCRVFLIASYTYASSRGDNSRRYRVAVVTMNVTPHWFISPHGIAMPKGLYFSRVVFSTPISEVTERISTKLKHIFTAIWKVWSELPQAFTPTGWGQKTFLGDRKYLCNGTWYKQSERKLFNLQGLPYMPTKFVNFGPQTAENGWRVFAHYPKVCTQDELQAHITV